MILVLLGVDADKMNCEMQLEVLDGSMTDIEKARCIAEWQADVLAMRLAIPEHTVDEVIAEIANDPSTYYENSGDRMQACVIKFAKKYGVSCHVAKKRLRQLGYDFVDGTIIEFDGEKKKPFYFTPGTLKENETFVLDNANYERLMLEDGRFAELIESGICIYNGYVVCVYDAKYIRPSVNNKKIGYKLTDYALEHADECCLKFSISSKGNLNERYAFCGQVYLCNAADDSELEYSYLGDKKESLFKIIDKKKRDKAILDVMKKLEIDTFSQALVHIMDKVHKPRLTKKKLSESLNCDEKTIQNYRKGMYPNTIEKVMLICLECKTGPEVSNFLIEKSVGGIPNVGMKRIAYNMLLDYTDLTLNEWNEILQEFELPPISFKQQSD